MGTYACEKQKPTGATPAKPCGDDDTWKLEGNKCYKIFSDSKKKYFEAKTECQTHGGELAAPKTDAIQKKLNTLYDRLENNEQKDAETWIGLDDCGSAESTNDCKDSADGIFTFSDNTKLTLSSGSSYENFKDWEPVADLVGRQKQDCVKFDNTLKWDDDNCEKPMTYACEKPTA